MRGGTTKALLLVLSAVLATTVVGCSKATTTGDEKTGSGDSYKLGAVLSLTGTYAGLGKSEKQAIDLEVKRINDAGGVNGHPLEVIIEDDGTDEAKAVSAASKLIEQDRVLAILGATGTGQTMAIRGDLQRAGIPQISMAGGNVVTGKFDPLVFQTPWTNTLVVPFVLDKIKRDGHSKIALLSDSGGYGKDGREIILKDAAKAGVTVVSDQTFNPGDTDLSAQLTKVKSSGADALLFWTAGKEAAIGVKNASDLGLKLPMYGGSGQARKEFAEGAGPAAEGFVFGTGKSLIPENWGSGTAQFTTVSDFAKRYEAAYGEPADIFAGHAFDAVSIISDALKRAGDKTDGASLRDAVEQTKDLPGFGGTFTFGPTDHNGLTSADLALYAIKDGAWTAAK